MIFKIPEESPDYDVHSAFVIEQIGAIMKDSIDGGRNKIFIHTNLKRGLPLENINKVAGPFVEAWAVEQFENIADDADNIYQLINAEAGTRLSKFDIVLQFRIANKISYVSAEVDVKATAEDIVKSGKSPNITSYARIRSEYVANPDFIFIILSLKHKVYGEKQDTGMTNGIMEVVSYSVYDIKFISARDLNYNPSLGTGQLQIRDIHYVDSEQRTTWEFCQLLDAKFIRSKGEAAWLVMARKQGWIKTNYLKCGDAASLMRELPTASVDLLVADPPYNLGKDYGNNKDLKAWHEYEEFTRLWLCEAYRLMKPTATIYVFMGVRFISNLFKMMEDEFGLVFNGWITWHYTQGMGRKVGFSPRHEDVLYFTKSDEFTFNLDEVRIPQKYFRKRNNMSGANPGDVWQFSHVHYCSAEREKHPTQKPEALMERIVRASSNEGDLVVDPFVGSGTTCRVANLLNRRWIGIDLNPDYVQMSERRLKENSSILDSVDPRIERIPRDLPKDDNSLATEEASAVQTLFN